MIPAYDASKDFMVTARAARARGELHPHVSLAARMVENGLMVVAIQALPDGAFNPAFLNNGPAVGRPLLTPLGSAAFEKVAALALAAAQGPDQQGLAAVMLMPEAVESARERLTIEQAAA